VPAIDVVPLIGHVRVRTQLAAAAARGTLPASLLLHGPPGIGKQRLALWLARQLLCLAPSSAAGQPADGWACGACQSCRYMVELVHPDLRWVFPRPRPRDGDPSAEEVFRDYADAIATRVRDGMLYAPAEGTEGIYVATVRALVRAAALTPALAGGQRKVLVVGNAERMVAQEGTEFAANAFLKLLEEPPADTTIVLTSSAPGGLLPTIRSRVAAVRVSRLEHADVEAWVGHARVRLALDAAGLPASAAERVRRAGGAPGMLLAGSARQTAAAAARALLEATTPGRDAARYAAALRQGSSGARGAFAEALDALTDALHARARSAVHRADEPGARAACAAIATVEAAKLRASGNANPQLVAAELLRGLADATPGGSTP